MREEALHYATLQCPAVMQISVPTSSARPKDRASGLGFRLRLFRYLLHQPDRPEEVSSATACANMYCSCYRAARCLTCLEADTAHQLCKASFILAVVAG